MSSTITHDVFKPKHNRLLVEKVRSTKVKRKKTLSSRCLLERKKKKKKFTLTKDRETICIHCTRKEAPRLNKRATGEQGAAAQGTAGYQEVLGNLGAVG